MLKHSVLFALALFALVGCGGSNTTSVNYQRPLTLNQWAIFFSPSMPATMLPDANYNPYFDFSVATGATGGVHYVIEPGPILTFGRTLTMTFTLTGTGTFALAQANDPGTPALRLFLWERGDDMGGVGPMAYYRWWSHASEVVLTSPGTFTISVPLTPDQWSSVYGEVGNNSAAATAGFNGALANLYGIGFTFGGDFFGHGVGLKSGAVRFTLTSFMVQ